MTTPAVAIIYDKFLVRGGGERVCEMLIEAFPDATVYALNARPREFWERRLGRRIISPPLGGLFATRTLVTALYPLAAMLMALLTVKADVVIAYSSTCGKFARLDCGRSILYSNYPNRGLYQPELVLRSPLLRWAAAPFMAMMRPLERCQLRKFNNHFSISDASRQALLEFVGIDSDILMPPFDERGITDVAQSATSLPGPDYYIVVSRLEPEKEIGYVIEAFRGSPYRLKVIGKGSLLEPLRQASPENVEFLGYVEDDALARELTDARALIFPSNIEYSLVPLEATFLGTPVISFAAAAMREILIDVASGRADANAVFYTQRSADALTDAIVRFAQITWDVDAIKASAARYGRAAFIERIRSIVYETAERT